MILKQLILNCLNENLTLETIVISGQKKLKKNVCSTNFVLPLSTTASMRSGCSAVGLIGWNVILDDSFQPVLVN